MVRDFYIAGECLVKVKSGGHFDLIKELSELGLAEDKIEVSINPRYYPIRTNESGEEVPEEILFDNGDATIRMTLVHYDEAVLRECIRASFAGADEGKFPAAMTPLGGFRHPFDINNNLVSLNILSERQDPYRFPTCYLEDRIDIPLSVQRTGVQLVWRAFPHIFSDPEFVPAFSPFDEVEREFKLSDTILYYRTLDDAEEE